ncbi:MAG: hypothetical protein KDD84_17300 [Caldilineaceae bacterium]|nr:hypothetical protein [Caldilineaceae bacterium]
MTTTLPDFFCTDLARSSEEQIAGSAAALTTLWLALEVPENWGNKALPESNLPAAVKDRLRTWEKTTPGARLQLIKQGAGLAADKIHFFVALADDDDPRLYRLLLQDYNDLLSLDLDALLRRDPVFDAQRWVEPIFLVCTNGKRDRCCAKWGLPLYRHMAAAAPGQVWQTTHIGGHRFAPTLVCLPESVTYGWLDLEDAAPLVQAHRVGNLYRLDRYRGRSTYAAPVQAAEAFLRAETGVLALDAYRFVGHSGDDTACTVEFVTSDGGLRHRVELEIYLSDFANPNSCGKAEGEPARQYRRG